MVAALAGEPVSETVAVPSALLDRISGKLQKVQMLPAIAQQALEVAKDPECSMREFARIIEQDIKLATEMLRIANSSAYCAGRPVVTLADATLRMGLQPCKNLIITSSFASLMENFTVQEEWVRDLLWRHGMVTAVVAANLNRTLRTGFQGEEFTAGLIHDMGRILLAVSLPEEFLQGDPVDFDEHPAQLEREKSVFGASHTELGAWFALGNRLPECLVSAIRHHHAPAAASSHRRLATLIAAADHMANFVQRNESAEGYDPASNDAVALLEAEGVSGACARFQDQAATILERSCEDALELCGA
jgi:HD-like signal output (HDOD) protein